MPYTSDNFESRSYSEAEAKKVLARLQSIIDNEKEYRRNMLDSADAFSSILSASGDVLGMISQQEKASRSVAFKIKNDSEMVLIPQYTTIKDVKSVKENMNACAPGIGTQIKFSYSHNGGINAGGHIEIGFMLTNSKFDSLKCVIDFQTNYDEWHPRMVEIIDPETDKAIKRHLFKTSRYSLSYIRFNHKSNESFSFGLATFNSLDSKGESYLNLTLTAWRKAADDVL
ncbi:hypothetical protein Pfra02_40170 [Pseudomonas fragi]|nr:hypothetical protein Pfra02_40170 [Pseudomonas fragi]